MKARRTSFKFRLQATPDFDGDVLGGRDDFIEGRDFVIQMAVVHGIDDFAYDDLLQLLEVINHPGCGVGRAFEGDFEDVIMAVAPEIGGRSVEANILVFRKLRASANVGSGKLCAT